MFSPILFVVAPLLVLYVYNRIRYWRFKQYGSWPQLTASLVWGHMKVINDVFLSGAPDRHPDIAFSEIHAKLGYPPVFVLDVRPLSSVMCIVCNHEVAEQLSKTSKKFPYSVTKSPTMRGLVPLIGPYSILTREGEEWKSLRKQFNPGFASQHLMSLLPCILDKTWHFLDHLDRFAHTGEEFNLAELCINLTFDIIGAVTMDINLDAQLGTTRQSKIIQVFRELGATYRGVNGRSWLPRNPRTMWRRRNLSNQLDVLIKERITEKFAELKLARSQSRTKDNTRKESRSVLSLSLRDTDYLTPTILQSVSDQLKTFLFAGHDTTGILLQWAFYELSRTPRALNAMRAELDEVFGPDPDPTVVRDKLLSHGEDLMRRMSYTSAVIKEILRLYPPASSARMSYPGTGYFVRLPDGRELNTDGLMMYNCASIIQRDAAIYGETKDVFVPERWLGDTDTSMQTNVDEKKDADDGHGAAKRVPPSAWRPFERGPRNCIGQELANIESRVILACAVRRYNFTKVGLGEIAHDGNGEPILNAKGQYEVTSQLYNTQEVTAKPADGTRMRVKLNS